MAAPGSAGPAPAAAPECREAPARTDVLAGLGPRGELHLASGARAVLDGIHWPEPGPEAEAAEARLLRHRGRRLTLVARGETDRWGRAHVDASADAGVLPGGRSEDAEVADLAAGLVEAGLAQVDAGERDSLCRPALLAVEAGARRAGRGIWNATGPGVRDGAALRARMGRFVVAEGAVLWVGERARRTYLDFARKGENGLTVTVSKRTWRQLQERGLSAANLRGRQVRVRGRLEAWRGPTLDVASADMIEILPAEGPAAEVLDGERAQRR
ncbi:DNA-binding protein [Methylobacterium sp. J-068]|nr:DNA-binding protein [Methylobacterium sp. J-068]MCJ2035912.1 DNA-binding protein [Methylobacterium sp. J-068]